METHAIRPIEPPDPSGVKAFWSKHHTAVTRTAAVVLFLLVWESAVRFGGVSPLFLSSPSAVALRLISRESLDEADATKRDYIGVDTSLGMSRGIPGYPGGLPRGSAGEAGPVPPRPLPSLGLRRRPEDVAAGGAAVEERSIFAQKRQLL